MIRTLIAIGMIAAQAVATFDAASITPNVSGETRVRFEMPPGRLNAVNAPVRFLIRQAYRVPEARVIGGPAWVDTSRFDIRATAGTAANGDAVREMLRALLRERFGLALRPETREMPVYVLKIAHTRDNLGPNLRRSTTDCTGRGSSMVGNRVQCGVLVSSGPGSVSLRGGGTTIANFVRLFGDFLDRPLLDGTGLDGVFDLELQFNTALTVTTGQDEMPSMFTALQEQLGLKLEAERGRADLFVIDAVSQPTPN